MLMQRGDGLQRICESWDRREVWGRVWAKLYVMGAGSGDALDVGRCGLSAHAKTTWPKLPIFQVRRTDATDFRPSRLHILVKSVVHSPT
jgi:hypothetical protein